MVTLALGVGLLVFLRRGAGGPLCPVGFKESSPASILAKLRGKDRSNSPSDPFGVSAYFGPNAMDPDPALRGQTRSLRERTGVDGRLERLNGSRFSLPPIPTVLPGTNTDKRYGVYRHSPNVEHSSKCRTPAFKKYFGAYPKSFVHVWFSMVYNCIHMYAKLFGQAAKYFLNVSVLHFDEGSTFAECLE